DDPPPRHSRSFGGGDGRSGPLGRERSEIGDGEALLEVELARLPVETGCTPVVEAVSHVGRLLNLEQEEPAARRVDGSRAQDVSVSGSRLEGVEARLEALLGNERADLVDGQSA